MGSRKKSQRRSDALRPLGLLGRVIQGWKFLSQNEKLAVSYRVVFAVDLTGRNWQLLESGAPLIIGEGWGDG